MAFWSTQRIKQEQRNGLDLINPFDPSCVHQGAYEMSLSDQVLTTLMNPRPLDSVADNVIRIHPGQFALAYTQETVRIPPNVIAFISIKASVKFDGLVNVSGFHVDPGYNGRLKFSVYNAGTETIHLEIGRPTFLIWFSDLDQPTEDPYGYPHEHVNQTGVTPTDRMRMEKAVPSPPMLDQRLGRLEDRWRVFVAATKYFLLPVIAGVVAGLVLWLLTTLFPTRTTNEADARVIAPPQITAGSPSPSASP